jgi:hypothetical protein
VIIVSKVDWTIFALVGDGRRAMLPPGEAMVVADAEVEADARLKLELSIMVEHGFVDAFVGEAGTDIGPTLN